MELEVRPFSLRDSIETALAVVADPAAAKDVDLVYDNQHGDFPDKVLGDVTRFKQILLKLVLLDVVDISLLGNAVKFTEKGHILVKVQVDELPRDLNGRLFHFHVAVEDTVCSLLSCLPQGIGISPEKFKLYISILRY
jgi:osomolarity two-component system sensor histidine kinase CHK1